MKFVEPIRDLKKISQIKNQLKGENKIRDLVLFELGINSALRISDLLSLKIRDLFFENGTVKNDFEIREQKTGKVNKITITPKVKKTLELYKNSFSFICKECDNFVFFNQRKFPHGKHSIGRKQSWVFLSKICQNVGLNGNFGNHSLRKTWGFQARKAGVSIDLIQHKLNHSSASITKRYIGITDSEVEEICNKLDL